MGVDRSVSSGTSQVLVLPVRNVKMSLGVSILFGETEIDDIDLVSSLANTHQEVVWLDVSMNEISRVDVLDSRDLRGVEGIELCELNVRAMPMDGSVCRGYSPSGRPTAIPS